MHRSIHSNRQRGMTLIELMVVVSITAILLAIAIPSFTRYIAQQTINGHISALASSFRLARSESLKRGLRVSICPTADPQAATPTCLATADPTRGWATGWLVYTNSVGPLNTIDNGDLILSVQPALPNSGGILPAVGTYMVHFYPNGIAIGAQGRFNFRASNATGEDTQSSSICINSAGNTRRVTGSVICS